MPEILKPYVKDGKINIEEIGKRESGESDAEFESRIWAYIKSPYCTKEFTPRQEIHYKFSDKYMEGRSYYMEPLKIEKVVPLAMKGELQITNSGDWGKKVVIHLPDIGGILVTAKYTKRVEYANVHFSNRGIHVVPRERGISDV